MQRIISIFLLFIMLTVGAHPTLVKHFCEGDLYSVSILDSNKNNSCCPFDTDNYPEKDRLSHENCCNIQQIQISTDDYQHQEPLLIVSKIQLSFNNLWFTWNNIVNWVESDNTINIQHFFPSRGLAKQNIDLLTYLCIYRI